MSAERTNETPAERRDRLCTAFGKELKNGGRPSIRKLLADVLNVERGELLLELIREEIRYRWESGELPTLEQYKEEYPEYEESVAEAFHTKPAEGGVPYALERELATGGQGTVFLSRDNEHGNNVAIKVLHRGVNERRLVDAFKQECRLLKNATHEFVVPILDDFEHGGNLFIVLKYIEGATLAQRLKSGGPMAPVEAAQVVEHLARTIHCVHTRTVSGNKIVVHRDLKPANVILDSNNHPHVVDFGLAALSEDLTEQGSGGGGTFEYMSPEQATKCLGGGENIDVRTDIWALGVILYESLTGKLPYGKCPKESDARQNYLRDRAEVTLVSLVPRTVATVPDKLYAIIERCLQKQPSERYQSAGELAEELNKWIKAVQGLPCPLDFSGFLSAQLKNYSDRPWLFDEIDGWLAFRDQTMLLIVGGHGTGKSTFLAELIRRNSNEQVLAYHICRRNTPKDSTSEAFVLSLVGMLCQTLEGFRDLLSDKHREELKRMSESNWKSDSASVFESCVLNPLWCVSPSSDKICYIVIDAFDELLGVRDESDTIVELLASRIERLPEWLRIIATTQRDPSVLGLFPAARVLDVDGKNGRGEADHQRVNDLKDDIRRFIEDQLRLNSGLAKALKQSGIPARSAIDSLMERSGLRFRHVDYALKGIARGVYSFERLDEIPPELSGYYRKFLESHFPSKMAVFSKTDAYGVFAVILAAQESPTERMIAAITGLDFEDELPELLRGLAVFLEPTSLSGTKHWRFEDSDLPDWLSDKEQAGRFYVSTTKAQERLFEFCEGWQKLLEGDERNYALRYELTHLAKSEGGLAKVANRVFKSDWVQRKLQAQGVVPLLRSLDLVIQHFSTQPRTPDLSNGLERLRNLTSWIGSWGWAIADNPALVDQWWKMGGEVTSGMPRSDKSVEGWQQEGRLLGPILGPADTDCGYSHSLPTSVVFQTAVCQLRDRENGQLVFATESGGLSVHRVDARESKFHRLFQNGNIVELTPLTAASIAVLVRCANGEREVQIIDDLDAPRPEKIAVENCKAIGSIVSETHEQLLLTITGSLQDGSRLNVMDLRGTPLVSEQVEFPNSTDVRIIPFSTNVWAVFGSPHPSQPKRLILRKLSRVDGQHRIEPLPFNMSDYGRLNGICVLPENRLAIICQSRSKRESVLVVLNERGQLSFVNTLYVTPEEVIGRYNFQHATDGLSLLNCVPIGWHSGCGVVLSDGQLSWSVQLEPESIPVLFPPSVSDSKRSDPDRLRGCSPVLGTSDGRLLAINNDENIAVLLGSSSEEDVEIQGLHPKLEVLGCRKDGSVVVCDQFQWGRVNYRTATPPFDPLCEEEWFADDQFLRLTSDGLVLSQEEIKTLIEAAGERSECWEIWGATTVKQGVVCILGRKTDGLGNWKVVLGRLNAHAKRMQAVWSVPGELETSNDYLHFKSGQIIATTADGIVAVSLISSQQEESVGIWLVNLERREHRRIGNGLDKVTLLEVPGGDVLTCLNRDALSYETAEVRCYKALSKPVPGADLYWSKDTGLQPALDVESIPSGALIENRSISTQSFVLNGESEAVGHECRIASITTDWWGWSLNITNLRRPLPEAVWQVVGKGESHPLKGKVVAWSQRNGWLVVGFESGRIEVQSLTQLGQVSAVGYVTAPPNSLTISESADAQFVVVSAGGSLTWFRLPDSLRSSE